MPRTQPARALSTLFTRFTFSRNTQAVPEEDNSQSNDGTTNKREEANEVATSDDDGDEKLQLGVKQMEAIASAWSTKVLVSAYIGIFLVFFLGSFQQQVTGSLTPYVTSAFSKHSLLSTTSIMSSIIGAVAKLPVAKIIDIWGRAEGYIMMVTLTTLGLIMMAACKNVETYSAAQVFYWIGYNGIVYVLDVFLADTSSLKNRGWLFAFSTSPYIATTFAGPAAADSFYKSTGWRWVFGTIWTHTFPYYLDLYLPEAAKGQAATIYASLPAQLSYPMGSPERDAIIAAYAVGQKWMLVAGLVALAPAFVWVLMWRNIQLKEVKQVKGTVV